MKAPILRRWPQFLGDSFSANCNFFRGALFFGLPLRGFKFMASNSSDSKLHWQHSEDISDLSFNHASNIALPNRSISLSVTSHRLPTIAGEPASRYERGTPWGAYWPGKFNEPLEHPIRSVAPQLSSFWISCLGMYCAPVKTRLVSIINIGAKGNYTLFVRHIISVMQNILPLPCPKYMKRSWLSNAEANSLMVGLEPAFPCK